MIIEENHLNTTRGYHICEPIFCDDPFTDDPGELFRHCQKEYGRCTSSVYVDRDGKTLRIGWVFEKTDRYEDTGEPFMHETWITLHTERPTHSIKRHYLAI